MVESRKEVEKRMAEEVEKRVTEGVTTGVTILIQVVVVFIISVVVFKFVWTWVVPDLFPGAITLCRIKVDLTWLATVKLAVLVGVMSGFYQSIVEVSKNR